MSNNLFLKIGIAAMIISVCFNLYQCDNNRDFKKELSDVRAEIKLNKLEKDSLLTSLKGTQDSLKIAFNTIDVAHAETDQAKREKQFYKSKYEKIHFVGYATDHERDSILSVLFPTFRPVR